MKKINLFKISIIMYIIPFLLGAVFYSKLPDLLPVHFDINGNPDSFKNKNFALFLIPSFVLLIEIFAYFMSKKDPRQKYQGNKIMNIILIFMPLLMTGIITYIICYSLGFKYDISKIVNVIISILFIMLGNYFPKTKRNYTIGFRTPWNLASDENWNKTHKMTGKLWVVCGIIMLLFTLLSQHNFYIINGIMLWIMVVVPMIYSYLIYKKESL